MNDHIPYEALAAVFAEEASPDQRSEVENWKRAKSEHEELFEQLFIAWEDTGILKEVSPIQVSVDAAWDRFSQRLTTEEEAEETPVRTLADPSQDSTSWRIWSLRIAASCLLLIGLYWLLQQPISESEEFPEQHLIGQRIEAGGIPPTDTLSDGSLIQLQAGARLIYPPTFTAANRVVRLEGEAFFQVEPEADRPFVVQVGTASVEVLGTSFLVKAPPNADSLSVFVESGRVKLAHQAEEIILQAGEAAVFIKNTQEILPLEPNPDADFWRDRNLNFQETELGEALRTLSQLYGVSLRLADELSAHCPWTITLDNQKLEEILKLLELTFDLEAVRENETITLHGSAC